MSPRAVGVDIGTGSVTVAEVRGGRQGPVVTNFGGLVLPDDAVREGEIVDAEAVGGALRDLLRTAKITPRRVWLGVANQRVVVRQVTLPWLPEPELRDGLRFHVQEHIPIPVEEAELDVHLTDDYLTDEGERMQRVLLVAAHQDMVAAHVEAATAAGLKPVGIDLNPFAVLRAMGQFGVLDAGDEVLIDIGAAVTNLVVHRGGTPTFVRILVLGGRDLTEAIAAGLDIDRAEAETLKRQLVIGDTHDVASRIVTDQAETFVDEVRSSLEYHRTQSGGVHLSRVTLTGGGAMLAGLADRLAEALRLPVSVGSPFSRTPAKGTVHGEEDLAVVGPTLATAIGLGLGGLE